MGIQNMKHQKNDASKKRVQETTKQNTEKQTKETITKPKQVQESNKKVL